MDEGYAGWNAVHRYSTWIKYCKWISPTKFQYRMWPNDLLRDGAGSRKPGVRGRVDIYLTQAVGVFYDAQSEDQY